MNRIVIIGGGLAGLMNSILLNRAGFDVTVIEKRNYPFHRVCGEYISNEVLPFLKSLDLNVEEFKPANISRLAVSSVSGKFLEVDLDTGGLGLSRYCLDDFLYRRAASEGVKFILGEKASDISFHGNQFEIVLPEQTIIANLLIGAYGKRSNLDMKLNREFFYRRSPYMGVKYHIRTDFPNNKIQLDNFKGGYCGIVKIESDRYCLCYLSENRLLKTYGTIAELERTVLCKNPFIKDHFENSYFLFEKPEVINEISFESKAPVEDHILFCGDAAGMITPLCGNGMAIAIHSAKILAETIVEYGHIEKPFNRTALEKAYATRWKKQFTLRLKTGRMIQSLFGNQTLSDMTVAALQKSGSFTKFLVSKTHGKPF
jgi:flavin-dependent dehydrogenase